MFKAYRSGTGTFILIHPSSGTTATGDQLNELYVKLEEQLPEGALQRESDAPAWGRWPAPVFAALGVMALLPLLWIGAFQYTLRRTLDDGRLEAAAVQQAEPATETTETTTLRIKQLEKDIVNLQRSLAKQRPKPSKDAPARKAAAQADATKATAKANRDEPPPEKAGN